MTSEPPRLYAMREVAASLGLSRKWTHNRLARDDGAPKPEFVVHTNGKDPMLLWSEDGLRHWHAYYASTHSLPKTASRYTSYSDHRALNIMRGLEVTWKLWWRCRFDGGTMWWFSTPQGWWTSEDDGVSWKQTGLELRPTDYRYYCVNGTVKPSAAVTAVLRSATNLRRRLEGSEAP